jgi:anti-sigma regulatory factor (Ser/Thr protein kinase)
LRNSWLEVVLRADVAELGAALDRLDAFWAEAGVGPDDAFRLRLAVDELVNNVIDHGYPAGCDGEIRLKVERRGGRLMVELEDDATLHNPFVAPTPDLSGLRPA